MASYWKALTIILYNNRKHITVHSALQNCTNNKISISVSLRAKVPMKFKMWKQQQKIVYNFITFLNRFINSSYSKNDCNYLDGNVTLVK